MLPAARRLRRPKDFSLTIRRGGRAQGRATVAHAAAGHDGGTRFGVIVGKNVGGAVQRNLVKRRLRAIAAGQIQAGDLSGWDVVVRALPGAAEVPFDELAAGVRGAIARAQERARRPRRPVSRTHPDQIGEAMAVRGAARR